MTINDGERVPRDSAETAESERAGGLVVADVLGFGEIRSGSPEIFSGGERLDRPVRWIHIADAPEVERFLEGGELVLTTAQTFRRSAPAMAQFLDQLEHAGAAGVIVELVNDDSTPDDAAATVLRAAAADRSLPVICLRRRVKFVRITELAHRALLGQQLGRLERAREIHETYTQLSLERAEVGVIVARTAALLGAPVILEDVGHRVLAHAGDGSEALAAQWRDLVVETGAGRAEPGDRAESGGRLGAGSSVLAGHLGVDRRWHSLPVGLRARRWGRLVVPGITRAAVPDVEQIVERAAQALTLTRMAERDERDLVLQAQSGFVREILDARHVDEDEVRVRARSLGFDPPAGARLVPVVVRIDHDPAADPTRIQLWERAVIAEVTEATAQADIAAVSAQLQSGSFGLILALPGRRDETKVLDRVFSAMPDLDVTWTVGVGRSDVSLIAAIGRLPTAAQVAEVASTLEVREQLFYRSADVRLRGLLAVLGEDSRLRAFAEGELGPLLDGDDEMLDFLDLVLTHGGNKSALARAGFLSRPALYARLAKLEERLGVSLDDAESRTALHVALLWWRMHVR
ncbi:MULTISPECIES: PucR family transcriptional regulator [Brevibacterium]|uniref:PucR family transcriptional regulator n=1 Tax=Brevibacterium sanguinis TaxID=232444 RepID=UPI0031DDC3B6